MSPPVICPCCLRFLSRALTDKDQPLQANLETLETLLHQSNMYQSQLAVLFEVLWQPRDGFLSRIVGTWSPAWKQQLLEKDPSAG